MPPSIDEALATSQDTAGMSAQGPNNPAGKRPRMVEALASLKEGLRDTADPLYDGWKLRPRVPASDDAQRGPEGVPRVASPAGSVLLPPRPSSPARVGAAEPIADDGEAIDITLDGGPGETPTVDDAEPATPRLANDREPETPRLGDFADESFPTEEQLIETPLETAPPTVEIRRSVQTDTVRVRIIRYQPFPRWALVLVAALLVFAASVVALRASFPHEAGRSARSVPANHVSNAAPRANTAHAQNAVSTASNAVSPVPSPAVVASAASAAAPWPPFVEAAPPQLAPPASSRGIRSADDLPPAESPSSPASKAPGASRRRSGGHDFFRDPGF